MRMPFLDKSKSAKINLKNKTIDYTNNFVDLVCNLKLSYIEINNTKISITSNNNSVDKLNVT